MLKDLFKSTILYGLASTIGSFVGLFLVPIYTRIFTPEQYGIIDLIQTVTAIIAIFGMLLLESATQRYYYEVKDDDERRKYLSTALWTICTLSLVCVLIIIIISKELSLLLFSDVQYYKILILASIKIPLFNIFALCTIIIRYMKKPTVFALFILIQILTIITLSIWLVVYKNIGIMGVFYGQVIGYFVVASLIIYFLRKTFSFYWHHNIIKKLLAFSLPVMPAQIGVLGSTYANRFIMLGYLSLSDIGLYTIALKISSVFLLIQGAFANAWYPFFYENLKNKEHKEIYKKVTTYITILVFILVSVFSLFSKELLVLLTTEKYYAAAPLIGILAFSHCLIIISNTVNLGTLITKKTIYGTYAYLSGMIFNVLFLFLLVPGIGIIGVPISIFIGNVIFLLFAWIVSEKLYYIGFNKKLFILMFILTLVVVGGNILAEIDIIYKTVFSFFLFLFILFYFRNFIKIIVPLSLLKKSE